MESYERDAEIHKRVLAKDHSSFARLAHAFSQKFENILSHRYEGNVDRMIISEAINEAFRKYLLNPDRYNPSGKSLESYLFTSASWNLQNALSKENTRRKNEQKAIRELTIQEKAFESKTHEDAEEFTEVFKIPPEYGSDKLLRQIVLDKFADPVDLHVAELLIDGIRATEAYAEVLGCQHLSKEEKEQAVKRNKDRISARIKRMRVKHRGEL